jgi:pimeloyl-ACP methyl ester carboxylesterase
VAQALNHSHLGTLLFDLLTPDEERIDDRTRELRFDIELLARRVIGAVDWVYHQPAVQGLPIGLFGASTGAAAALVTAAFRPNEVRAVVSRGGRPDLAGADTLEQVFAPTLLIVGGNDDLVIDLNEQAMRHMRGQTRLVIVPGATHLFEESGALEEVARLARRWFEEQLN